VSHLGNLNRFYSLMDSLREQLGGYRYLAGCRGKTRWPRRGLYFFLEEGESRSTGAGLRIVRVGTHALTATSKTTLWNRLSQHRGTLEPLGGNHRGSIFRLHVGEALLRSGNSHVPAVQTWGKGTSAPKEVTVIEKPLEAEVSSIIGAMPFLWLEVENGPDGSHQRGYLERNAIGLLSHYNHDPGIDPPSNDWLGRHCSREAIRRSGIWNVNHVTEQYDSAFLDALQACIDRAGDRHTGTERPIPSPARPGNAITCPPST
jgi:hypothetical protein